MDLVRSGQLALSCLRLSFCGIYIRSYRTEMGRDNRCNIPYRRNDNLQHGT